MLALLVPPGALAQEPPRETPAMRGLVLALQQLSVATEQYVNEVRSQLATKDTRIAELEKQCGDPCKSHK